MNHSSLVSILIPTYQGEKFLEETLSSALSQTYSNLEIIVSDDGSTDKSIEIAQSFQEKSSVNFKIINNLNKGMINNWNNCLINAQGKYIKFLFQDDLIKENCIEEMVNLAEQDPEIGLVFSPRELLLSKEANQDENCLSIYEGCGDLHSHWSQLSKIQSGQDLLKDPNFMIEPLNKIGEPSTVLIKAEVFQKIGEFEKELYQLVDLEMWTRIMVHYKIGFIDKTLSYFRIHPDQQTIKNMKAKESVRDYSRFYKKLMTDPYYNLLPQSIKISILKNLEYLIEVLSINVDDLKEQRNRGINQIKDLEIELRKTQSDFFRVQAELETELRKTQSDFFRVQAELEKTQATLQAMKNTILGKINYALLKFTTLREKEQATSHGGQQ